MYDSFLIQNQNKAGKLTPLTPLIPLTPLPSVI